MKIFVSIICYILLFAFLFEGYLKSKKKYRLLALIFPLFALIFSINLDKYISLKIQYGIILIIIILFIVDMILFIIDK